MIPAGYQVQITTWENDADNYGTEVISGLTEPQARGIVWLAQQFRSKNDWTDKGFGNGSLSDEDALAIIHKLQEDFPDLWQLISDNYDFGPLVDDVEEVEEDEDNEFADALYEYLVDNILGNPAYEGYRYDYYHFCRVYSSHTVYLFKDDVLEVQM